MPNQAGTHLSPPSTTPANSGTSLGHLDGAGLSVSRSPSAQLVGQLLLRHVFRSFDYRMAENHKHVPLTRLPAPARRIQNGRTKLCLSTTCACFQLLIPTLLSPFKSPYAPVACRCGSAPEQPIRPVFPY